MSEFKPTNPVIRWIEHRLPIFSFIDHSVGSSYPSPRNLNYWWNYGSLAGIALVIMIISGIMLAMQYTPHADYAFDSVERIMRDVNYGWLLRYIHMNGGSFFFIVVYIHLFRGLYYGSYKEPRELLWIIGIVLLLLMQSAAFMGYVLPWGQLSYWAAKVITNMFTAFPIIGEPIVTWLWGGYTVGNPTLNRFYALHYLIPFIIVGVVIMHIWALHRFGSNNPVGIEADGPQDKIPFHPYYTVKDLFGFGVFLTLFAVVVFFAPNMLGETINYVEANPMVTPAHIVPEWYFLPSYAILRSVNFDIWFLSAKLLGVIVMFGSTLILFLVPWLDRSPVRSARFRPWYKWFFWIWVFDCVVLTWVGANPPEAPYFIIGQVASVWYFTHFLIILPLLSIFEPSRPLPSSISEPVLKGGGAASTPGGASGAPSKPMEKA